MARVSSASMMKRNSKAPRQMPDPGTKVREVWDRLQANKGKPVSLADLPKGHQLHHIRHNLTNYWGLDIAYRPHLVWTLVGEWFGKDYHDYLAKKIREHPEALGQLVPALKKRKHRISSRIVRPDYDTVWKE